MASKFIKMLYSLKSNSLKNARTCFYNGDLDGALKKAEAARDNAIFYRDRLRAQSLMIQILNKKNTNKIGCSK